MDKSFQSRRQQPPPNQTPLYAVLGVGGLVIIVAIVWLIRVGFTPVENRTAETNPKIDQPVSANGSKSHRSTDNASAESKSVGLADDSESEPDRNGDDDSAQSPKKVNPKSKPASEQIAFKEPASKKNTSNSLPKLSDLKSYKNNPNREKLDLKSERSLRQKEFEKAELAIENEQAKENKVVGDQFALPRIKTPIKFFQELIVERNPIIAIEGIRSFEQKFKYRVISKIIVAPSDDRGFRKVTQQVVGAELVSADAISKRSIAESVRSQVGKEFRFLLDHRQKLIDFRGDGEKPKSVNLKDLALLGGLTGEGVLVTSVMDLDGWKEMARLTFVLPKQEKKKWTDQMEHNWGDLGRWVGETLFTKKSQSRGMLRIDYQHRMKYEGPDKEDSDLPFKLGDITFRSDEAGGRLSFDLKRGRIDSLVERFRVEGRISASMLGSKSLISLKETQSFQLFLHDQKPQQ